MYKFTRKLAALFAALLILACATTAFAANIAFDGAGGATVDGSDHTGNYTITTSDADNTISGDGSGYSVVFTDSNASVEVVGDTTVGGISATGDLTITGDSGVSLTSTGGPGQAGITLNRTLTIDGELTVNAVGGDASTGNAGRGIFNTGNLIIGGGATVNATGGDSSDNNHDPGYGVSSGGSVHVINGTLNAQGGTGPNGNADALAGSLVYVNGEQLINDDLDDLSGNKVTLTTKQAEPEQAEPEVAEPAPAPAPKPKPDLPPPIVAVLYDVTKTGDAFSFKTIIANGKGNMAGATVTVQLNEKYKTTVTIGEDGIGEGTIEAPGYAWDTANFSTRPNVPGGVSVGTAYRIYGDGRVVRA